MKIDGTFGIEPGNRKVVPNPEYSIAQFEESVVDEYGNEITSLKPFPRYRTLKDAQERKNQIPSHILQPC